MNATFYKFSKKANSTLRPDSGGTSKTCELKEGTSELFPVFILKQGTDMGYNYVYVPAFHRYYWVTDCVNDHKFVYYYCRVDVLASYYNDFKDTFQYVSRSATRASSWIKDTYYPPTLKKDFSFHKFVGASNPFAELNNVDGGVFIVGVVNGKTDDTTPEQIGGITYYVLTHSQIRNLMNSLVGDASFMSDNVVFGITKSIMKDLINPLDWIACSYYLPIPLSEFSNRTYVDAATGIVCGRWTMPNMSGTYPVLKERAKSWFIRVYANSYTLDHHPQYSSHGAYMDTAPFTERILRTGPWGDITLDTDELVYRTGNDIYMTIDCDFMGNAILRITTGVNDEGCVLYQGLANISVPFRLNQIMDDRVGLAKKELNELTSGIQAGVSIAAPAMGGGLGSTAGGTIGSSTNSGSGMGHSISGEIGKRDSDIYSRSWSSSASSYESAYQASNSRAAAADIGNISGSMGSYANSAIDTRTHMPKHMSSGSVGSFCNLRKVFEIDSYFTYATENMVNLVGRPLCESVKISDLTGFCMVLNPIVGGIAATITELEMLKRQMADGFFIEA